MLSFLCNGDAARQAKALYERLTAAAGDTPQAAADGAGSREAVAAIDTEMNHFLTPEELAALTDQIPAGRLGTPEEAADLVWQLTQSNAYLTGQVIGLDGGWI